MLKLMLVLSAITLMAFTCRKSGTPMNDQDYSGKWNLVETWMNTGAEDVFNPVQSKTYFVEFKTDGSFHSNIDSYSNYSRYEEVSDRKIKLFKPGADAAETVMIELNARGLKTFRGSCIEGCGELFSR